MDYQKENIKTLKPISKTNQTQNYDWDIIVPDSKPDVSTIVSTDGTVNITSKEIMQDRAIINGNVKINILYISSDESNCVKSIDSVQNFNCVLELQDLRQNMTLNLYTFMTKISSDLINSRKICVSSLIDFYGTAYDEDEICYIENIEEENIQCQTKEIKTLKMTSCFETSVSFNENIEVPVGKASIMEILKIKSDFSSKEIKNANNKLILRGNLLISTVYLSNADVDFLQFMTHEIPINEIIDCECLNENSILDYDIEINNFNYILKDNNDGEKRIIKVCGDIVIKGKIFEDICICPVIDTYSINDNLKLEKCIYNYDEILNKLSGQFSVKDSVSFNNIKDIQKILLLEINNDVDNVSNICEYIKIKGAISVNMLYISMDGELCFAKSSLPFEHNINSLGASTNTLCDLKIEVDSYSYNILSSDEIELRVNLSYKLRVKNNISQEIVQKIDCDNENTNNKNRKRGITVFFCDGNENLWDIAKKYKTTVDDIVMANDLEEHMNVKKGMKLLIP